jgi:FMN phosphatase YigB (HAD superfamily)
MMDIIFDIDGTLIDISHRLHLIERTPPDWEEFRNPLQKRWDEPRMPIINIAVALEKAGHNLLFCSGRRESEREDTLEVLSRFFRPMPMLWMRKDKDYRPDTEVKAEMLQTLRNQGFNPVMAFDDRPSVIRMWKEHGLTVADVGNGVEF